LVSTKTADPHSTPTETKVASSVSVAVYSTLWGWSVGEQPLRGPCNRHKQVGKRVRVDPLVE
jgi:hypothetical protein